MNSYINVIIKLFLICLLFSSYKMMNTKLKNTYVVNDKLLIIKDTSSWKGNYINSKGQFENLEHPFEPNWFAVFKWKIQRNKFAEEKKIIDDLATEVVCDTSFISDQSDVIVWLGHASFFIRVNGVNILTDPVFNSPSIFIKRKVKMPFEISMLPKIDYILLSHDHRDHLDKKSLNLILRKSDTTKVLTGLRMGNWLNKNLKADKYKIEEAGWYQQYTTDTSKVKIYFLPARHWSKRGLFDTNHRLWGSFIIQTSNRTIYFSGDSGYGNHFKDVGSLFNQIDISIMGIGAYEPEWFMSPNHISPKDALRAASEMGAKALIPMHYGTFDMSDEPLFEPINSLIDLHKNSLSQIELLPLKIGQNYKIQN